MTKKITNNVLLENFDTFEIIENIKEVDKLQKVFEGCTLDNDFKIVRERNIAKFDEFQIALNYFNCEISHNYVNFNTDCSAYEVHEYILVCYRSDYNSLYDVPKAIILNGGFNVE